jgi:hypothetical protein
MPKVTGKEDHRMPLDAASALTRRFRRARGLTPHGEIVGHYLGRAILEEILAQPGCVGIRMYHGQKEDGRPTMVVVGVDGEANDLYQGVIAQETWPCPPLCGVSNPLTS